MKSIIAEIYCKHRGNHETIKIGEEYKRLTNEFIKAETEFVNRLDKKLKDKYLEIENLNMEIIAENCLDHYKEGFKLGMLLVIKAFLVD